MNGAMREALVAHAVQVCTGILGEQLEGTPGSRLNGGFEPQGRTTPASTRLEGLLASLEFLPSERRALRSRIEQAVHRGVRFLLRSQITSGPYAGAIPGAVQEDGEVDSHASEIRIDYVQHFVCAMIRYRALLRGVAPESNVH
jgi:hypothetical protein